MEDFETEHLSMIALHEESATEIERALFTKLYGLNDRHYALLSIQSLSILYSYWEGFVQKSFQMYIDYLNSLNIRIQSLNDQIFVFQMEHTFKQFLQYPGKSSQKIKFYRNLNKYFLQETHDIYRMVDTESNIKFHVLNRLMEQFSLEPFPEHWGSYRYPNPNLKESLDTFVRYRNAVAHGGDLSSEEKISQDVYAKYKRLVSDLMYEIHDRFMVAIQNKTYLRESSENN